MIQTDKGIGLLADQTVTDIAQNAVDSYTTWEKETFALGGLLNTVIYAAIVAVIAFIIIKLIQHFLARKLTGNARIFYRLIYVAIISLRFYACSRRLSRWATSGPAFLQARESPGS